MAILAGAIGYIGRKKEQLKFRIVGCALLVGCLVVGSILGFSVFVDPIAKVFAS